jgi:flagellar L-ring protein precursor FlgH
MPNLASLSSNRTLDGQGETVRETVLSTVLTARVTHVMPNGNLIVEAVKNVTVNSETQKVIVRGLVRPIDLSTGNAVRSNQIGMLEVSVAGKGVVGDAVKQPNVLYRILLGLLPF